MKNQYACVATEILEKLSVMVLLYQLAIHLRRSVNGTSMTLWSLLLYAVYLFHMC